MELFERNLTKLIWYVLNKQNQMVRSPFCLEIGPDCLSGANLNRALSKYNFHFICFFLNKTILFIILIYIKNS